MDLQGGKRMLGNISSRFGLGRKTQEEGYDEYYDDGFEDYADYGEYDDYGEYGDDDARGSAGAAYDPYGGPVTTREIGSSRTATTPRLVSIEDVRARTLQNADAASRASGRTMVNADSPSYGTTPRASVEASGRTRSEGLDSLFSPTTPTAADPAQRSAQGSSFSVTRTFEIIHPSVYADAEAVAAHLKKGSVVILVLTKTPDALAKRLLDFSFGVACALDASVECIADGTFAITADRPLTDAERMSLRGRGVL